MTVEATIQIEFGDVDASDSLVVLEFDDVLNVDSEGDPKTSFAPGDDIYFRLQTSLGVVIEDIVPTDGTVQPLGAIAREAVEISTFLSREELTPTKIALKYIPFGSIVIEYIGRNGVVTRSQTASSVIEYEGDIAFTPFLAEFTYTYLPSIYVLRTPNVTLEEGETYPIVIVVYLTTPAEDINNGCNS